MQKTLYKNLFALLAVLFCSMLAFPGTHAYLTDSGDSFKNPFTIALNHEIKIVEDFTPPTPNTPILQYFKSIQAVNSGEVECYARVRLDFSDSAIEDITQFSMDNTTWVNAQEWKNHLPEHWHYDASDGYYYYDLMLVQTDDFGQWVEEKPIEQVDYDMHYEITSGTISGSEITTPLVNYIKTSFAGLDELQRYSIYVYAESCPAYMGNTYTSAWTNYLETQ